MSKKIADIAKARAKKRLKKGGWTMKEIKEAAKRDREIYKKLAQDEPDDLVSGDMNKIDREEDDDD